MGIAQRIHDTIEEWRKEWGDRLKEWMASWLGLGLEGLMDKFEPDLRDELKPALQRIREIEGLPSELKIMIDKALEEPKALQFLALLPYLLSFAFGVGLGMASPAMRMGTYFIDEKVRSYRLDPATIITAWRRDPDKFEGLFDDLRDLGWSEDRIEALKFVTLFYPSPSDLVTWQAREVFEPEMVAKYGLDDELGGIEKEPFYKAGMTDEQIRNYWRAHWEHASWIQVVEMLRRGQLEEKDVWDWFRLVEIPPFWRQKLINISYAVPTRVDVRRWWDMRTIDEARLREIYAWLGYHDKDLDDYVLWTKVYVAFPDLIARYKNGWIDLEQVKSELLALNMPKDRVEEMIEAKVKKMQQERTTKERDLTKSEIIKGVKKEVISRAEGIEMLQDMGYDAEEAEFIMDINIAAESGSPESYAEFKELTQKYRRAAGMSYHLPPEEVVIASRRLAEAKKALKEAEEKGLKEAKLDPYLKAVSDAEYAYRQLYLKWKESLKK